LKQQRKQGALDGSRGHAGGTGDSTNIVFNAIEPDLVILEEGIPTARDPP